MINLLNTLDQYNNLQDKEYVDLVCNSCGMTFSRIKNYHKKHIKDNCKNAYCSNACQAKITNTFKKVNCRYCKKEILKRASYIKKKAPNLFCDSSCFAKWNNKNRKLKLSNYFPA